MSLVTEDVVTEGFRHTFNNRVAMGCLLSLIDVITIIGNGNFAIICLMFYQCTDVTEILLEILTKKLLKQLSTLNS